MKRFIPLYLVLTLSYALNAQNNISEILAAGLVAAQEYSDSYTTPAGESFVTNLSTGWYDDAKSLNKWQFELSLKGQATFSPDDQRNFVLDPQRYAQIIQDEYDSSGNPPARIEVSFADGSTNPRNIATALGVNNPSEFLIIRAVDQTTGLLIEDTPIELGQGLENENVDFIPTVFLQAGLGLGGGLEIKARFVPKIQVDEAKTSLYGGAVQWEITKLFEDESGNSAFPLRLAALGGLTKVDAEYDFRDGVMVDGVNQTIEVQSTSFTFAAITSTRWNVFNLFAGVNYVTGSTESDLLGTYTVSSESILFPGSATFEDPLSVRADVDMIMTTVGAKLNLGPASLVTSYTFSEYSTANAGLAFRF
ncbi:hypothetical protein BST97_15345 [Nonlabens spongiae]|uniref:Uncharacterized protein n=1 Tax=Nonlabens spongiae TaxID=331648 RepID=A0A1W6MNS8_9FLAO|nr:DUF6588 family protein [Nonlabens spongiae]ARN79251.1 hypothetical protein BST97_15345 [Nonlabens spongiae]